MKDFLRNNGLLLLIIAVLLSLITALFSTFFGGMADPLKNLWGVVTAPARNVVTQFAAWTESVYNYSFQYEKLEEENEQLKEQLAELEAQAIAGAKASQENESLRELLGLREKHSDFQFESAKVISRSTSNWESVFTINRGQVHAVEAGDCVIDSSGAMVGVVAEVGANWSTVRTIIDPDTEMGGLIARTDSTAIAEGDFALMEQGLLKLSFLPENTQLIAGDLVLTSGMNGNYPPSLIIGTVTELHTEASGMSRYAVLTPRAALSEVKQVFVITDFDVVE